MATVYRCDRCSKDFQQRKEIKGLELPHTERYGNKFTDEESGYTKELCAACMKLVIFVVNNIKVRILEPHESDEFDRLHKAEMERALDELAMNRAVPATVQEEVIGIEVRDAVTEAIPGTGSLLDSDIPF